MPKQDEHPDTTGVESSNAKDEGVFRSDEEGMSIDTVRIAIDRKLRKELMGEYDILELKNEGRYYAATARTKDGLDFRKLLIDKQSGKVVVYN